MNTLQEKWVDIAGTFYQVSNQGKVRSTERWVGNRNGTKRLVKGSVLKSAKDRGGYLTVSLYIGGNRKTCRVHHLVAQTFIGDRPLGLVINHIDGCKTNNWAENLEYCTRSHNVQHAYNNGLAEIGENHPKAKLTEAQVIEIRRLYASSKITKKAIAKKFGVGRTCILNIIRCITWKHIPNA